MPCLIVKRKLGDFGFAGDDHVVPFEVGPLDVRGRIVQLGPLLDSILARHDYPEPVARLLAEACVVAVLLGTSLKFEGKFILQTRTDGPVDMLVADFSTPRSLRAYARFDADRLAEARGGRRRPRPRTCSATACWRSPSTRASIRSAIRASSSSTARRWRRRARTYFRQSEQIPTEVRLEVAKLVLPAATAPAASIGAPAACSRSSCRRRRSGCACPTCRAATATPAAAGTDRDRQFLAGAAGAARHDRADRADRSDGRARAAALPAVPRARRARLRGRRGRRRVLLLARDASAASSKVFPPRRSRTAPRTGVIRVSCEFCSKSYEFDPADFASDAANRECRIGESLMLPVVHHSPSAACPAGPARRPGCRCRTSRRCLLRIV